MSYSIKVVSAPSYQWLTTECCILNSRMKLENCLHPQSGPNTVLHGTKCSAFNHHTWNVIHSLGSRMAEYHAFIAHSETTTAFCSRWQNNFMDHHTTTSSTTGSPKFKLMREHFYRMHSPEVTSMDSAQTLYKYTKMYIRQTRPPVTWEILFPETEKKARGLSHKTNRS